MKPLTHKPPMHSNYYAFGMEMPNRKYTSSGSYRYGFNGKENDLETNTQDYGLRIYDGRVARFLSVDPLMAKFPYLTPYQFAGNNPIKFIDLDGAEPTSNKGDAQETLNERSKNLEQSTAFPNVKPEDFVKNLNDRINNPDGLCQGEHSNFCGPSALMSQVFASTDPQGYVNFMLDLYQNGSATYNNGSGDVIFNPSEATRNAAGLLSNGSNPNVKGSQSLNQNPADQMLLLSVKDKYNLNVGGTFKEGKQNGLWASTTFAQEILMAEKFLGYTTSSSGSTFGGAKLDISAINSAINDGKTVILFVNGPIFRKETHSKIREITGTHFIRVHQIKTVGDKVVLDMWDYGVRRQNDKLTQKELENAVYGVLILDKPK